MQDSLKVKYIPTHHRKEHNASGTNRASFSCQVNIIYVYIYIYNVASQQGKSLKSSQ